MRAGARGDTKNNKIFQCTQGQHGPLNKGRTLQKGGNSLCAMSPREALVGARFTPTQGFRIPTPEVAGHRPVPAAVRTQLDRPRGRPRAARSVVGAAVFRATEPGRPILVLLYPVHASRTTVSSLVRVLPPLTLAVAKPAARFFIAHARRRCRLVRTGTGGHTILSRVFYVTSCRHYDKSATSPRLNPRSSAAHRPASQPLRPPQ